eukprot:Partr_v1_DN24890_c1_g1_i7_m29564 putative centrin, EF-hand protein
METLENQTAQDQALAKKYKNLTESEIKEIREIFCLVDLDSGGTISSDELAALMKTVGLEASAGELANLLNEVDDETGEIDFESFVQVMSRKVVPSTPRTEVMRSFQKFESPTGPPGHILIRDLFRVFTEEGDESKRMTKEQAGHLIRQVYRSTSTA